MNTPSNVIVTLVNDDILNLHLDFCVRRFTDEYEAKFLISDERGVCTFPISEIKQMKCSRTLLINLKNGKFKQDCRFMQFIDNGDTIILKDFEDGAILFAGPIDFIVQISSR